MKKLLIISCLLLLASGSMVQAATVSTPEAKAAELVKRYELRIKDANTKKANDLKGLSEEATKQIAALNKERADKLKNTRDANQIKAINKEYNDKIAKVKASQGVKSKTVSDTSAKQLKTLQADLSSVKTQITVERKARERDAAKIKQERAKKTQKTTTMAELKKADEARQAEIKKNLAASKAKRAAEQAAWAKRHPAGSINLDNSVDSTTR